MICEHSSAGKLSVNSKILDLTKVGANTYSLTSIVKSLLLRSSGQCTNACSSIQNFQATTVLYSDIDISRFHQSDADQLLC